MSNKPPIFTRQHFEYLNTVFPEETNSKDINELLQNSGKRSVVKYIEHLVLQIEQQDNTRSLRT